MDPFAAVSLSGIGLIGGFVAGLLGIGGGVIMIPLLLYVAGVPIKLATGLTMAQAFAATVSGLVVHRRNRTLDPRLGLHLGLSGFAGALAGSFGSAVVSGQTLLSIYLLLVLLSLALLLFDRRQEGAGSGVSTGGWPATLVGFGVGALAGMLGVGGGFVLIPLMVSVLRVPIKVAVGTSLLAVLMVLVAGGAGKIATGQFDLAMAVYLVLGSVAGAQVGGRVNARVSARVIKASLILLLVAILVRTMFDLLGS